ncbi:isoleucine--tRNA ligase [Haloplasma contractile]|uniref:Isoleucine--tRNA ligase n=1 Tax=Haloplasma contractile SSD-17B TaxID=1033810 RepID=U2FRM3_9MOLU|nr:isoleucine--tRNA ligase [Haloplasma contractile]ERJ13614.1 Isoleucine--tRNA ligase 1 protein [Haloplasma contractile SSD-17B]
MAKEYKDTLLMPKTDFKMRGNLGNREPELQKHWEEMDLYHKIIEKNNDKPTYILHDGPPYANGNIHMGHALNKVLKDFVVRFKNMSGFKSPYIPGWDTHGLPIETALTKKKKVKRKELSPSEFREKCAEYALEQVENQKEQFKRLGVMGEWEQPYITLQKNYEARQLKLFAKMVEKGLIYKGLRPVYWSWSSETALAEAEIEYHDKKSPAIYVAFNVMDGKGVLDGDEQFIIWTTTPWTIPANLAICLHPELEYSVVLVDGNKYIVASDLVESLTEEFEWSNPKTIKTYQGAELEHVKTKHPLYDRVSLITLGEHVTADATGCVHTAPGHGEDDFNIGKQYGLEPLCPVDDRGIMTKEAPGFEGLHIDKANKAITEKLEATGALIKLSFINHSYPHDWRTKKPIIFRVTPQWYASIDGLKDTMMKEIESVKWLPSWGDVRLGNMIKDRTDWCISRQRVWGVPIPVFYAENGEEILDKDVIDHVSELFKEHGSNIWFDWSAEKLLPEGFTHAGSPNNKFRKETDIMDVWFDSGTSHQGVLEERGLPYPADLYLEGSDQYRGWFNSSLSTGVAMTGKSPYKQVVSHGFVLDANGRKMSKSLGNVVDPLKIMKQLGADILRLWVSSVDYQADVRISDNMMKQIAESYRKFRNTFRFLLGNLHDFDPKSDYVDYEKRNEVDQYVTCKLNDLVKEVLHAYENFEFDVVYRKMTNYVTQFLSSFYLDFTKDILYIEKDNSLDRRSIQSVLYDNIDRLSRLLAPILSHTTDEVYQYIPGKKEESIHLTDMPKPIEIAEDEALKQRYDQFLILRRDILKALEEARNKKIIGKSFNAKLTIYPNDELVHLLNQLDANFQQIFIVSQFEQKTFDEAPETAMTFEQVKVLVEPALGHTCARCWQIVENVNEDEICSRCEEVIE